MPLSFSDRPGMPPGLDQPDTKAVERALEAPVPLSEPVPIRPNLSTADSGDSGKAGSDGQWDDMLADDPAEEHWRLDSGLWDETATKMDLARAYIEMQDPDAARAILEDVVQDGTEAQRAEAQSLLAKCG
jgi:pilus assembly protein FimV